MLWKFISVAELGQQQQQQEGGQSEAQILEQLEAKVKKQKLDDSELSHRLRIVLERATKEFSIIQGAEKTAANAVSDANGAQTRIQICFVLYFGGEILAQPSPRGGWYFLYRVHSNVYHISNICC
jgi:hypothetical protein